MTLEEIKSSTKAVLTCGEIAEVLGSNPHDIRCIAHERPELLGFPVICIGCHVKIPRLRFLEFMGVTQ